MTKELKTFNDLKKEWEQCIINESAIQEAVAEFGGVEFSYTGELIPLEVVEGSLKEEAIKDIKKIWGYFRNGKDFRIGDFCFYCQECVSPNHVVDYIKWKFNITEKDLESPHLFVEDDILANQDLERLKKKTEKESKGINISQVFDDELDKLTDKNITKICKKQ